MVETLAHVTVTITDAQSRSRRAGVDPKDVPAEPTLMDWVNNMPFAMSKNLARQTLFQRDRISKACQRTL